MDKDPVAEKILSLTLEIISLLSGEDYMIVRKPSDRLPPSDGPPGTQSPSPVPPPHSQKILELTHKMLSLLTGEVPVRCDDVTVYFSMEEWEYLEGHQELYRDVMMETRQPRTSLGSSEVRGQAPNSPPDCKPPRFIKEETESSEDTDTSEAAERPRADVDRVIKYEDGDVSAPDTHTNHAGGDYQMCVYAEEESVLKDHGYCIQPKQKKTTTDTSTKTHTGDTNFPSSTPPQKGPYSCPECRERFTSGTDLIHHRAVHNKPEVPSPSTEKQIELTPFSCPECGKRIRRDCDVGRLLTIHASGKPFSCAKCEKTFSSNSSLVQHVKEHSGEKPFCCPECGMRFKRKSHVVQHRKLHTEVISVSCPECGKRFNQWRYYLLHQRRHKIKKKKESARSEKA